MGVEEIEIGGLSDDGGSNLGTSVLTGVGTGSVCFRAAAIAYGGGGGAGVLGLTVENDDWENGVEGELVTAEVLG